MRETPFLPDLEADIRDAYEQLVDKHGGSEDLSWAVRSSATAEDLPDASFAGQQETFLNVRGIENILLAIKEVFASLYNDRAIAYRVHHEFEHADGRALGRRPADGALRRRRLRRDVHHGHRVRLPRRRLHHLLLRPRRGRRPGRGQPGRVLRLQARAAGRPARPSSSAAWATRRPRWSTPSEPRGRPHHRVRRRRGRRRGPLQPHRRRGRASWPGTRWPSRSTTAARWTSSGARTGSTAASTSCRPAPRPCSRARPPAALQRFRLNETRPGAGRGPRDRPEDRRRRGARAHLDRADARVRARRGAGRRHDRPRLGADHEARLRDRHQPRRPHLPRRDHRPRAGHPRRRRHRRRHPTRSPTAAR